LLLEVRQSAPPPPLDPSGSIDSGSVFIELVLDLEGISFAFVVKIPGLVTVLFVLAKLRKPSHIIPPKIGKKPVEVEGPLPKIVNRKRA
jgi:hypothetical protein